MSRIVVACTAIVLSLVPALGSAQGPNKCLAGKNKCASKHMQGKLKCHNKAEKNGTSVDPVCIQKAQNKYDGGTDPTKGCFAKLEARNDGPCVTTNDSTAIGNKDDAFVDDVVTDLDPVYPSPVLNACSAGKKKCVLKKAAALLKCHEKAVKTGFSVDGACLQKARDKFDGGSDPSTGCFAKLEARGGCLTGNDTAAEETKVDNYVDDVLCELGYTTVVCGAPTTTPTPTPTTTSTAATPTATTTATITPGGVCPTPSTYNFTAAGTSSDEDFGWTGETHDNHLTTNARITLATSCSASPPCMCSLSGPIPNAGGPTFANHRCRGDSLGNNGSWIQCTSDADCPGSGNGCTYFFGPPQPIAVGGLSICHTNEITGVIGTALPTTGSIGMTMGLVTKFYLGGGGTVSDPCPRCVAGTCDVGQRAGFSCTVNGTSAQFGDDTSYDCPPSAGVANSLVSPQRLQLATGTQTRTLTSASPNCRAVGQTSKKCFCDICNDAFSTPCMSNADCIGFGVCGGKRCQGGANAGAPCAVASECPSGGCNIPGAATAPNQCSDSTCTPNPLDTDSIDEGECVAGPMETFCTIETFRGCLTNSDCPAGGDTCNLGSPKTRECYNDNGALGGSVSVAGVASTTAPTFGALFCMPPSSASSVSIAYGLPGLGRVTLPGTASFN